MRNKKILWIYIVLVFFFLSSITMAIPVDKANVKFNQDSTVQIKNKKHNISFKLEAKDKSTFGKITSFSFKDYLGKERKGKKYEKQGMDVIYKTKAHGVKETIVLDEFSGNSFEYEVNFSGKLEKTKYGLRARNEDNEIVGLFRQPFAIGDNGNKVYGEYEYNSDKYNNKDYKKFNVTFNENNSLQNLTYPVEVDPTYDYQGYFSVIEAGLVTCSAFEYQGVECNKIREGVYFLNASSGSYEINRAKVLGVMLTGDYDKFVSTQNFLDYQDIPIVEDVEELESITTPDKRDSNKTVYYAGAKAKVSSDFGNDAEAIVDLSFDTSTSNVNVSTWSSIYIDVCNSEGCDAAGDQEGYIRVDGNVVNSDSFGAYTDQVSQEFGTDTSNEQYTNISSARVYSIFEDSDYNEYTIGNAIFLTNNTATFSTSTTSSDEASASTRYIDYNEGRVNDANQFDGIPTFEQETGEQIIFKDLLPLNQTYVDSTTEYKFKLDGIWFNPLDVKVYVGGDQIKTYDDLFSGTYSFNVDPEDVDQEYTKIEINATQENTGQKFSAHKYAANFSAIFNFTLVNEKTGQPFNLTYVESAELVYNGNKVFNYKQQNQNSYVVESSTNPYYYVQLKYETGDTITRWFNANVLTDTTVRVCANRNETTHFEQIATSKNPRPVIIQSELGDCLVGAEKTRFSLQNNNALKFYTIEADYNLFTQIGADLVNIVDIDGSIQDTIDLNTLILNQENQTFSFPVDSVSVKKLETTNDTMVVDYDNPKGDNEDVRIAITKVDTNRTVFTKRSFNNVNDFTVYYDYGDDGVTNETLLRVDVIADKGTKGKETITRYYKDGNVGILPTSFGVMISLGILLTGLTILVPRLVFSLFGLFAPISAVVILSLTIKAPIVWFLMSIEIIVGMFMLMVFILQNQEVVGA